ncbi:MAG: hypothetical protein AAF658_09390, partial [Myxococcota bacterium]
MNIGIVGVGAYLPPHRKLNTEWSSETTARWQRSGLLAHVQKELDPKTEGERLVAEAILAEKDDPFRGAVERRIAGADVWATDMEARAAELALESAGLAASDIDLLLVHSVVPDYLQTPNACKLQSHLGIPQQCLALDLESVCNSFHHQVELARSLIHCGRARRALLVQSCLYTRLIPHEAPHSAWFGDGACAQVLAADDGATVLGQAHRTDGSFDGTIVASVTGGRWYDDGPTEWLPMKKELATKFIISVADMGRETTHAALEEAGLTPESVDFYASHQGTSWFR